MYGKPEITKLRLEETQEDKSPSFPITLYLT